MKSTTACDDQFIAGEDLAAGDLVSYTPEGTLVKGNLRVTPPAPPAPPPKTYGVFVGDPNVGTERAIFQKLQDPTAVYTAMLRGEIAKLTWRQMVHLCGPVPNTADEQMAEITRLRSEVKELAADIDRYVGINAELATELAKMREQKPVVFLPENWRPTRGGGVVGSVFSDGHFKVPLYAAPVPASHKGATHCDDCGLTWLDDGLNPLGCPYCKDAAPQAPDVPNEWKRAVSDFLSSHDAAWAELFKSLPADTRSVTVSNHQADAVRKANVLRDLLQSAEVRHD